MCQNYDHDEADHTDCVVFGSPGYLGRRCTKCECVVSFTPDGNKYKGGLL